MKKIKRILNLLLAILLLLIGIKYIFFHDTIDSTSLVLVGIMLIFESSNHLFDFLNNK